MFRQKMFCWNAINGLFVFMMVMLTTNTTSAQPLANLNIPHHPERLLMRFKPGIPDAERATVHQSIGAQELRIFEAVDGLVLVKVPAAQLPTMLEHYSKNPNVLYVEPDYLGQPEGLPNDPAFQSPNVLWGMDNQGQTLSGKQCGGINPFTDDPGTALAESPLNHC